MPPCRPTTSAPGARHRHGGQHPSVFRGGPSDASRHPRWIGLGASFWKGAGEGGGGGGAASQAGRPARHREALPGHVSLARLVAVEPVLLEVDIAAVLADTRRTPAPSASSALVTWRPSA